MLMAGFIKICSVHTPSSNPKLPPPKPLPGKTILARYIFLLLRTIQQVGLNFKGVFSS